MGRAAIAMTRIRDIRTRTAAYTILWGLHDDSFERVKAERIAWTHGYFETLSTTEFELFKISGAIRVFISQNMHLRNEL